MTPEGELVEHLREEHNIPLASKGKLSLEFLRSLDPCTRQRRIRLPSGWESNERTGTS